MVGDLVDLESPYAGDVETNLIYARRAMADSLKLGEFPIASHLLYTQEGILDDTVPSERKLGIDAGKAWASRAVASVVYCDYGISDGMKYGIDDAFKSGRDVRYRFIGKNGK